MKKISTCAKRRSLLAIIAFIAVIGLMLPLTGCSEPSPSVESIAVTTLPTKTMYSIGETLSTAGMVVTATFSDGSQSAVTGYSTSGFDSSKEGGSTVTVTYEGATASFNVTINPKVVARPRASLRSGDYFAAQTVTLSTTTEGATIRYTTDGSTPTDSIGTVYSSAIPISATTTIKAIAYKPDWADSSILTADYFLTNMTVDKWVDGNIISGGEQWFKFTATAATQYIHFLRGTADSIYIQLYEIDGVTTVSTSSYISSGNYIDKTVTIGKEYYIKVTPSNIGTYKILFSALSTTPKVVLPAGAITLTAETWTDGNIANAGGEQWFKFTASNNYHYINFIRGTLYEANVQLYNADGLTVGGPSSLGYGYSYLSTTNSSVYYIRLLPANETYSGTFKITFSTTQTPKRPLPTTGVTALTADTWAAGNITKTATEQWFKFTATAETQYIYFQAGSLNSSAYVQLYNADGSTLGSQTSFSSFTLLTGTSLTIGTEYHIRVYLTYDSKSYYGSYKIRFSDSNKITVPTATTLTADTWVDGNITATADEQWFKFTAGATNYLHFKQASGFSSVRVQLFNYDGSIQGFSLNNSISSSTISSLTSGNEYYVKVWSYPRDDSSVQEAYVPTYGTYKIAYSTLSTAPVTPTQVTTLAPNVFAGGNINANGEQWFRFTATADTQLIHFKRDSINGFSVQLYEVNLTAKGSVISVSSSSNNFAAVTVTTGNDYYIRAYYTSYTGQFRIGITTSPVTPGKTATTLFDDDTWGYGNIDTAGDEQWFEFTADTDTQYMHFKFGTLTNIYAQLYNSNGTTVGYSVNINSSTTSFNRAVSYGNTYYIKVWPYSTTGRGTYNIVSSASPIAPVPPNVTTLTTVNSWVNGNIPTTGGEQWFKFTATATTQYIHFQPGELYDVNVQLYESNANTAVGSIANLYRGSTLYMSRTLIQDNVYYIKVNPFYSDTRGGIGAYKIGFNTSSTPPTN